MSKKMVAVNLRDVIHHMDHIGIIAALMEIPLLVSSKIEEVVGQEYYPGLKISQFENFIRVLNSDSCDVVFTTIHTNNEYFQKIAEALTKNKSIKNFYCPHGFSDKYYHFKECLGEDYLLVYGQSMLDMYKEIGLLNQLPPFVISGNYRYEYFLQNKEFYRETAQKDVFSYFNHDKPMVLYAPSWKDKETDTSFFKASESLVDYLPDHFNLIIKLHPHLQYNDPQEYKRIVSKYENKKNVLFLANYPLVYPILDRVDIYIGDSSSIGYDFLIFDKPVYFLEPSEVDMKKDRAKRFDAGIVIESNNYHRIWEIVENTLADAAKLSQARMEAYRYAFGPAKPLPQLRAEIEKLIEMRLDVS